MTTETERCRTLLLSDSPATDDAFGPHDRLAQTIADLVGSDQAGTTIALEGGWGSGKSTVVNLLEAKLENRPNIRLVVFDAWAHQGDPLRRTFLESTMTSLEPWIHDKDDWNERRLQLSARRTRTNEERTPLFTSWGKFLAFIVLLVPVGLALASVNLLTDAPSWTRNLLVALGGFLAAAPIGTILVRFLWLATKRLRYRITGRPHAEKESTDTWAILTGQAITKTVTDSFESPNPTSVEFHQTFADLLDDALREPDKRLVLVLDNLDRVEPTDALAMWSTLQTFLQHGEHKKPPWLDRLWLIIPYDPIGISRLWEGSQDGTQRSTPALTPAFLDKTFQIRYEVPPPVLSQWQYFLYQLLEQAFPDHDKSEFHAVYRVFALHRTGRGHSPSPRDLKLYVNDIGALHQQRQDQFPLCHLAYYVLLRRDRTDVAASLLNRGVPQPQIETITATNTRDNLAALYYNVDVDLGQQLLFADAIRDALALPDPHALKSLRDASAEGFWPVLEDLTSTAGLSWDEPTALANSARCLRHSGILTDDDRSEARTTREALRNAAAAITVWTPFNQSMASGLIALFEVVSPDRELVNSALDGISASSDGASPAEWAESALVVLRHLCSAKLLDPDTHKLVVLTAPDGWVDVCHHVAQHDPEGTLWRCLTPKPQTEEVSTVLAGAVAGSAFSPNHVDTIRVTAALPINQSWSGLVASIQQHLQAPNPVPSSQVALLLSALWHLRTVDTSADQALSAIGSQGHATHYLHQAASEAHSEAFAWCAFLILRTTPAAQAPPAVGNAEAGHTHLTNLLSSPQSRPDVTAAFVDLLIQTGELPLLFTVLDANATSEPFVVYCVKLVLQRPAVDHLFTPEVFLLRWSWLSDHLEPEELDALSATLATKTDVLKQLAAQEFDIRQAGLYASLVRAGATSNGRFRSWCLTGLGSVTREQWSSQLANEGDLLDLLLDLLENGVRIALELPYMDALADHAKLVVGGTAVPSYDLDSWRRLLEPLSRDHRTMLSRRLLDAALDANGNIHESFFQLYGDEIARPDILRGQSRAPDRLFAPLVQSRNTPGLRWLAKVLPSPSRLERQGFERDTVVYFKDRVREGLNQQQGTEADALIQEIAQALNIHLPTDDQPDQAN